MKLYVIIVFAYLIFCIQGCEKIANETDPNKIILGKWKMVEMGNWPNMEPVEETGDYIEYLTDSVKIEYAPDLGKAYKIYWIDTILHECIYIQEEHRCFTTGKYDYEFYNKNKSMRLDYTGIALYRTFIYQRLK